MRKSKSHTYGNAYTDCNTNSYGHSHSYSDSNSDGDANTDAYSYGNSDLNADSNTGETITDGEASANITAAETIVGDITN